jgi:hypothetical protein
VRSPLVLKAAADLSTDFGRARDTEAVTRLLERAADLIDASGIIVWMGDMTGGDLRAILSHGYSPDQLARMPSVPRAADNATSIAYRTGTLQMVLRRPGVKPGAIAAPILGPDGCVGVVAAEINDGGETSEAVQAISTIMAAHLAGLLGVAAAEEPVVAAKAAAQR